MDNRWIKCKESYDGRIQEMAKLITNYNGSILDIGCGQEALKKYIPETMEYTGCDLVKRSEHTIVCNLNIGELPPLKEYDYVFCSGILEYLVDLPRFLKNIKDYGKEFIFSYAPLESSIDYRNRQGWVNHWSEGQMFTALNDYKYYGHKFWTNQMIIHLGK